MISRAGEVSPVRGNRTLALPLRGKYEGIVLITNRALSARFRHQRTIRALIHELDNSAFFSPPSDLAMTPKSVIGDYQHYNVWKAGRMPNHNCGLGLGHIPNHTRDRFGSIHFELTKFTELSS